MTNAGREKAWKQAACCVVRANLSSTASRILTPLPEKVASFRQNLLEWEYD
jgi:hypothetical protein